MLMSSPTLGQRFDPRHNSLSIMRLTLAVMVALVHAQAIGWHDQPKLGQAQIGDLSVDAFFVISGFLVTRSATRLPTLRRFVWHRALRILPGFWVCLMVVAFIVAPLIAWLQGLSPWTVLSGPDSSFAYVTRNAALLIRQWDIADLLTEGDEGAMDGALWTLFYEALCYTAVGILVAVGALRRRHRPGATAPPVPLTDRVIGRMGLTRIVPDLARRHLVLMFAVAVWAVHAGHSTGTVTGPDFVSRFLFLFLLGALGHIYAHRIRFPVPVLVLAVAVLAAALVLFEDYRLVGAPPFAYLLLWAIIALPLRWDPPVDLSYGVYVYHWPVEQVLLHLGLTGTGRFLFTLLAITVTAAVAYASWHLVEHPALRQKNAAWIDRRPALLRTAPRNG